MLWDSIRADQLLFGLTATKPALEEISPALFFSSENNIIAAIINS
jgi:hypothetical protein